ncbi:hypothetical protein K3172_13045 [Qipengyuania sp. 6B39]|uniref:hypothetical protein n=1 Tax=Qipengyuania proteolytica TaxID=2867239 RepID=UPI001C8A9A65|nr:hypothetical protein [Qipengyuania proteolytica]MBX7496786.1 hypothetical protein [Qipengyuania proteolytica]
MNAAALTTDAAPGFSIGPLTTYAEPAQMRAWLAGAEAGHAIVYATGPALAEHPAKALALKWQGEGKVELSQRRSARAHCFDYLARKVGDAVCTMAERNASLTETRTQMRALLKILRRCAVRGAVCPSLTKAARELGLPGGGRGRRRAQYLFDRLKAEKKIAVSGNGRNAPRVVTILAPGQGQGKSTKGASE